MQLLSERAFFISISQGTRGEDGKPVSCFFFSCTNISNINEHDKETHKSLTFMKLEPETLTLMLEKGLNIYYQCTDQIISCLS